MKTKNKHPRDENGLPHGEWVHYYNNGKLCYRLNHLHGKLHGLHEEYYEDGRLMFRGYHNMGYRHGIKEPYSNGKLDRFSFDHMGEKLLFVTPSYKKLSLSL